MDKKLEVTPHKENFDSWEIDVQAIGLPEVSKNKKMEEQIGDHIEILATKSALAEKGIVDDLVDKKATELNKKADVKVATAEAQLSQAEAEKIYADTNKAEAFFKANKQVLGIIGIKQALGYRTMTILFPFALTLFLAVAVFIYFPFSVVSYITSFFIDIIGDIFKKVATTGIKVFLGILASAFSAGLIGGIYYLLLNFVS